MVEVGSFFIFHATTAQNHQYSMPQKHRTSFYIPWHKSTEQSILKYIPCHKVENNFPYHKITEQKIFHDTKEQIFFSSIVLPLTINKWLNIVSLFNIFMPETYYEVLIVVVF
jgi:hypothetical protein